MATLTSEQRMATALIAGGAFFIVSSPVVYDFVSKNTGLKLSLVGGKPTLMGQVIHSAVFAGIMYFFILSGEKTVEGLLPQGL